MGALRVRRCSAIAVRWGCLTTLGEHHHDPPSWSGQGTSLLHAVWRTYDASMTQFAPLGLDVRMWGEARWTITESPSPSVLRKSHSGNICFVQSAIRRAKFPAAAPCTARNFKQEEASQREREVRSQKSRILNFTLRFQSYQRNSVLVRG